MGIICCAPRCQAQHHGRWILVFLHFMDESTQAHRVEATHQINARAWLTLRSPDSKAMPSVAVRVGIITLYPQPLCTDRGHSLWTVCSQDGVYV